MARFIFQLEPVLRQRKSVEREKQLVVAELETQRLAIQDEIRAIQDQIRGEKDEMRDRLNPATVQAGGVDLRGARQQAGAQLRLVLAAQQAVLRLAGVFKKLETARAALIEATKARRAVELLRERRYEQWLEDDRRREAAMLDEIAVMRSGRSDDQTDGPDIGRAA